MIVVAAIAAGALGAVLRYLTALALRGRRFPWAVLLVNAMGSGIGGVIAAVSDADVRLIVLGGLCGGLTTFSTFSVETIQLVQAGRTRTAALSVAANLALGIGAAAAGYAVATWMS